MTGERTDPRCDWPLLDRDPLYRDYHDREWGTPRPDDRVLFEFLVPESAGLRWTTVLHRREAYRQALAGFDPEQVAQFGPADEDRLLTDPGIIRDPGKVRAALTNARAFRRVQREFGSFDHYLWSWTGGRPRHHRWRTASEVPAHIPEAREFCRDLRKRGFAYVGPTIAYSFWQALGLVNDHIIPCFRWRELRGNIEPRGRGGSG